MFWVLAVGFSGDPLAVGLMVTAMVYMGGHISGGHYNPAASLAMLLRGKIGSRDALLYMIFQVAGAFTAAFICFLFLNVTFVPEPGEGVRYWQAIFAELLFTFALCSVVLAVAATKKTEGNYIYGLAVGLTVTASAYSVGSISGGAFNPAVGLGPGLLDMIMGSTTAGLMSIYLIGPFSGGALAAGLHRILNPEEN